MSISELQMGLVGVGGVVVVGIFALNKWQERKQRKAAEALANVGVQEPVVGESAAPASDRLEPMIGGEAPPRPEPSEQELRDASARRVPPLLPPEVDERADWVVRIESIESVVAGQFCHAAAQHLEGVGKPLRWFGFSDSDNRWEPLNPHGAARYHWLCAALQLVDRRGAASEGQLAQLAAALQRVCDAFMAIPLLPARAEAVARGAALDQFCAGVDIQIGVNVVARDRAFPGAKLSGLLQTAGLELLGDGSFHARDDKGATEFVFSNLEPVLFTAEGMRSITTQGVTLTLDVPRVADGVRAFERMMKLAQHVAEALGGVVVDDNRSPLGDKAAGMIRSQIEQFQGQMAEQGIPAGSPLALRLFS